MNLKESTKGLLKYILYHYSIDNKEAVWVLNYLKDHEALKHFMISHPSEDLTEGLTVTAAFQLLFQYNGRIITEADVIFNLLPELQGSYYLYFTFNDKRIRQHEERSMIIQQLDNRQADIQIYDLQLKREVRHYAESRVDLALLMEDKVDFDYFSTVINHLKDG